MIDVEYKKSGSNYSSLNRKFASKPVHVYIVCLLLGIQSHLHF